MHTSCISKRWSGLWQTLFTAVNHMYWAQKDWFWNDGWALRGWILKGWTAVLQSSSIRSILHSKICCSQHQVHDNSVSPSIKSTYQDLQSLSIESTPFTRIQSNQHWALQFTVHPTHHNPWQPVLGPTVNKLQSVSIKSPIPTYQNLQDPSIKSPPLTRIRSSQRRAL